MSKVLGIVFSAADSYAIQAFAAALGMPFDLLCLSGAPVTDAGAGKVIEFGLGELPVADSAAAMIQSKADGYSVFASVSSMASKDVLARVAGLLDAGMITDVIKVNSPTQFVRPIVAGTLLATVDALAELLVVTFRPAGFEAPARGGVSSVETLNWDIPAQAQVQSRSQKSGARPDLSQASIVVSGGRPLKDAATFEAIIGGLADALGGAAGATRAAVDSGIAANELQVGQTGKIVAPDLYIAAGISGSTQHMAGIKDSKIIVAINKDSDAPIFEFADLGLVADLFEAIPEFRRLTGK